MSLFFILPLFLYTAVNFISINHLITHSCLHPHLYLSFSIFFNPATTLCLSFSCMSSSCPFIPLSNSNPSLTLPSFWFLKKKKKSTLFCFHPLLLSPAMDTEEHNREKWEAWISFQKVSEPLFSSASDKYYREGWWVIILVWRYASLIWALLPLHLFFSGTSVSEFIIFALYFHPPSTHPPKHIHTHTHTLSSSLLGPAYDMICAVIVTVPI